MSSSPDKFGSISSDAYRSPNTVTGSATSNFTETAKPSPGGGTEVNANKLTQVYDPFSQANANLTTKKGFTPTAAPPVAPNKSVHGRDPYKSAGMPGETYLDNSGGPASVAPTTDGGPSHGTPPFTDNG